MNNSRPNHSFTLPLHDGSTVNCTVKTPVMKLKREVQELQKKQQMLLEENTGIYQETNAVNSAIGKAVVNGDTQGEADARKQLATILAEIDERANAQDEIVTEIVGKITNIPNDAQGQPRSTDDVDWDNVDARDLQEAISFFLNGPRR